MSKTRNARNQPKNGLPNIFVKVSGDEYSNPKFLTWLQRLTKKGWVVICIGGGTQISAAFDAKGYKTTFGPLGRETKTFGERQTARNVLEENQAALQNALFRKGIRVAVELPVVYVGTVLCHVNGDLMVRLAYLGFNKLYVVTTPERRARKATEFADLPKVKVVAFG